LAGVFIHHHLFWFPFAARGDWSAKAGCERSVIAVNIQSSVASYFNEHGFQSSAFIFHSSPISYEGRRLVGEVRRQNPMRPFSV
jgi:hypothetical protein